MSNPGNERLYNLLPAIYRVRDTEQGQPLRALLKIVEQQAEAVQEDIEGLYEDWFIETCADWVVPYIGDMVGNQLIHEIKQLRRADVAKTIYYRRRKGTAAMLEEMARDVTGWGAHAVEFFQLLGWTQNLNHLRFNSAANPDCPGYTIDDIKDQPVLHSVDRVGTVNLRSIDVLDKLNGPFDVISHTVDIRPIKTDEGWYNIRKIGFFLWRLNPYLLMGITPRPVAEHSGFYTFSRLGNTAPLFNYPQKDASDVNLAVEYQTPGKIRPIAFQKDLDIFRESASYEDVNSDYYGPDRGLYVTKNGLAVAADKIICTDLSCFAHPPAGKIGIDVKNGLLAFAAGEEPSSPQDLKKFRLNYTYAFSADIGGGPYERRGDIIEPEFPTLTINVAKGTSMDTLQKALIQWKNNGRQPTVIKILDSGVYGGNVDIEMPEDGWLMLVAENGEWPNIRLVGLSSLSIPKGTASLIFDGFLIEGGFELSGQLDLILQHCTLVPGRTLKYSGEPAYPDRDSLIVKTKSENLSVAINKSICGSIRIPEECQCLSIADSIIQSFALHNNVMDYAIAANDAGTLSGPPLFVTRSTIIGPVLVKELVRASETLFTGQVTVVRQQEGCVRFCYLPPGSLTPRQYRCQPQLAFETAVAELKRNLDIEEIKVLLARLVPQFTSVQYSDPGYAQLGRGCAPEICTGAEDGAEIGAFCSLKQPQREANLKIRLKEYLPFGLEPGFIYVT